MYTFSPRAAMFFAQRVLRHAETLTTRDAAASGAFTQARRGATLRRPLPQRASAVHVQAPVHVLASRCQTRHTRGVRLVPLRLIRRESWC